MLLTDRFVLLNYPRTGSTFARQALRQLYARRAGLRGGLLQALGHGQVEELQLGILRTATARREGRRSQHGALSQIPPDHRHKPVVTITRHPFDRLVSFYEHGYWRSHPFGDREQLRERFPSFPELSFEEYLDYSAAFEVPDVLQGARPRADVGAQTLHFVRFYAADPEAALEQLTDEAIDDGSFLAGLPPVRFLHTERLVEELTAFLHDVGFAPEETAFLRELPRVNAAT